MAGLISGIVALFTSYLGISGTIIGSVLSSFLYQLLSSYSAEKYDEGAIKSPNLANEIVYIFPLVVIMIIELIFFLSALHYRFDMLFDILESAVYNNLFRLMGIGLIILGAYPFLDSNNIHRNNGAVVLVLGVLLLMRGLVDITDLTAKLFYTFFADIDFLFALFVVIVLLIVIVNILIGSDSGIFKSNEFINNYKNKHNGARKIDTSFDKIHNFQHRRESNQENMDKENGGGFSIKNNERVDRHRNYGDGADSVRSYDEDIGFNQGANVDYGRDFNDGFVPVDDVDYGRGFNDGFSRSEDVTFNTDSSTGFSQSPDRGSDSDNLPLYEEEVILVNNPDDPNHPIKKRILKRVRRQNENPDSDNYQDMYIIDESD